MKNTIRETIRKYKKRADQDKDGKDVPKLESVAGLSMHLNLVNNNYQQACIINYQ